MQLKKYQVFSLLRVGQAEGTVMDPKSCVWHMMEACSLQHFTFVIATYTDVSEPSCGLTELQARVGDHLQALPFSGTN